MSDNGRPEIEFEEGSGNVFADLGLPDAEELFSRARLGFHVYEILKNEHFKLSEIASLLGIDRIDASHLMNGHFNRFDTDRLIDFLNRLDRKVTFRISPREPDEPSRKVGL
jgi:predicted XRE-type DNA-binding protein